MKLYGTLVADKIVPTDSQDTFPTHDEEYGFGGFRTVLNIPQRDLISMDRRKEGMLVFCLSDRSLYQLIGGIQNTNWIKFNGGIDYAQLKSIEEPLLNNDELMNFREGKPYKVSLQSLSNYLGNDLPATAYTDTDGQGFTDLENNYYTSL